jgi:hypothetical protein
MPMYSTKCSSCDTVADRKMTFEQYDLAQKGEHQIKCSLCEGEAEVVFDPSAVAFVLKDGESGGFVTKAMKENAYRKNRRKVMAQRERDHVRPNKLQPNYQGMPTASWEEAKDAAYQATYDKVKGEHGSKFAARAASQSAKTYDRHIKREGQ